MLNRLPRGPQLLALWLVLILVVSAALAVQAFRAERSHRRAARQVLANYAQLGATGLAERLQLRFGAYTCVTLAALAVNLDASGQGPAVDPRQLEASVAPRGRDALAGVRAIRRLGLDGTGGAEAMGAADAAVVRALGERDRAADAPDWGAVLRGTHRFAYRLFRDAEGHPTHVWVFDFDPERLDAALRDIVNVAPVLPRFLLSGKDAPPWLEWRLETADGTLLVASTDSAVLVGDFVARDAAPATLDGIVTRVRIDPAAAPALVAGGVPHSTLPQTLALLGLAGGLLALAYAQMRREAATARMREDFLASISHELRTPLANIRLSAETVRLHRVRDTAEQDRALEIAERECERLTHLIDNVLLASRSGRGALTAHLAPVELGALAREVAASFRAFAAVRRRDVRCEAGEGLRANADADLLRQALSNLLDNAVKYGPPGQIVTLAVERAGDHVRLRVEDQGPGIPAHERERVWERFFRLDRDRGAALAGSGLGLAVVRDIVALHGGTVAIGDRAGGGASFVLGIPAAAEDAP